MATETNIEKRETQDARPERVRAGRSYVPQVDIVEQPDKLLLLADMPGATNEDVDINYERGELAITARIKPRQDFDESRYVMREYGVGDFYRVFRVGEGIDAEKIEAEIKDGVLTVHLPKAQEIMPRKISVRGA